MPKEVVKRKCSLMEAVLLVRGANQLLEEALEISESVEIRNAHQTLKNYCDELRLQIENANPDSLNHNRLVRVSHQEIIAAQANLNIASSQLSSALRLLK